MFATRQRFIDEKLKESKVRLRSKAPNMTSGRSFHIPSGSTTPASTYSRSTSHYSSPTKSSMTKAKPLSNTGYSCNFMNRTPLLKVNPQTKQDEKEVPVVNLDGCHVR